MKSFLLAIQFLTVIPLKIKQLNGQNLAKASAYFPLAGLLIGLILSALSLLLSYLDIPALSASIILVVVLTAITAGIHLDGLADSADAFLSGKPKDQMLNIMRDPHIGTMGVLSIVCAILLKIGLLDAVNAAEKTKALILMCAISRWTAVLVMFSFPYARQEGKAAVFIRGLTPKVFITALVSIAVFSIIIWQIKGLLILGIASACAHLLNRLINDRIGGITGDTLGATIELTEIIILLTVCLAGGLIHG